jgi:orotidine-5'-phosphate decarboxylase
LKANTIKELRKYLIVDTILAIFFTMNKNKNPIICAIDTGNLETATHLCRHIAPHVGMVKLGLEFFMAHGPQGVQAISKLGLPIFLDVKLHDIPNTVSKAVKSLSTLPLSIITIHTAGGTEMMRMAATMAKEEAAKLNKPAPLMIGITVLTSLDTLDLRKIGVNSSPLEQVDRLALLAKDSLLDGIVCSPHEIETVKQNCGKDFITVIPGIRPASTSLHDQKRVMTPQEALAKGADYLVIGRPITEDSDPAQAAKMIRDELTSNG